MRTRVQYFDIAWLVGFTLKCFSSRLIVKGFGRCALMVSYWLLFRDVVPHADRESDQNNSIFVNTASSFPCFYGTGYKMPITAMYWANKNVWCFHRHRKSDLL